jgi:hypothetical protein
MGQPTNRNYNNFFLYRMLFNKIDDMDKKLDKLLLKKEEDAKESQVNFSNY